MEGERQVGGNGGDGLGVGRGLSAIAVQDRAGGRATQPGCVISPKRLAATLLRRPWRGWRGVGGGVAVLLTGWVSLLSMCVAAAEE